ncbi:hypothetical protein ACRXB1_37615, partial [Caballeronia sp. M23-90]
NNWLEPGHQFEWLFLVEGSGHAAFGAAGLEHALFRAFDFVQQETGCIAELPIGSANNWLEPGHQFEWLFLVEGSGHAAFGAAGLEHALFRAFDFVQ